MVYLPLKRKWHPIFFFFFKRGQALNSLSGQPLNLNSENDPSYNENEYDCVFLELLTGKLCSRSSVNE